jgi:hypothetical protein
LLLSAPLSLKPSCLLKPQTQCDSLLKNGGAELRSRLFEKLAPECYK